ncbi:hypothetical protein [Polynucleobacter sp. MWH-S4W17]|uniref:hypothetical protein n=1 Tax=Polynucleobacter sp. MWH-S4W17 TaxID=1855910 RepID=UPI001BFE6772|nr:hypothetical protein [Polynucleobacter sp. MWH-S4W17]QWD81196.1 hypothetical protein C2755_08015 [Polynucleobacter sp. MWH-S4W17]
MKILLSLLISFFVSASYAEDLLVPVSKFDNDSQRLTNSKVLEFWGYHNYDGNDNYQNILKLRYYNPLAAGEWRGRIRLDTSYASNYNSISSANNSGQYSAGNTMATIWGQDQTFLKPLGALVGGRVVFPFGNNGQWAVGPQLGWSFLPEVDSLLHVTDFSPLLRYMYGFDTKNNSQVINPSQPALVRNLQVFPTIGFQLSPNTMLRFWDENGAVYNSAGGGWFVPMDAMVTHRFARNWVFAVGASKQVVQSYHQYDWSTYAKVSYNF